MWTGKAYCAQEHIQIGNYFQEQIWGQMIRYRTDLKHEIECGVCHYWLWLAMFNKRWSRSFPSINWCSRLKISNNPVQVEGVLTHRTDLINSMDGIISSPSLWYGNMQNTLVRVVRLVYVDVLGSFRALYLKEVVADQCSSLPF